MRSADLAAVRLMWMRDPKLLSLPLHTRLVWDQIHSTLLELDLVELRFGDHVPSDATIVAVAKIELAGATLQDHLTPLLQLNLLERRDGVLCSPLLQQMNQKRAEARERRAAKKAAAATAAAAAGLAYGYGPQVVRMPKTPSISPAAAEASRANGRSGGRPSYASRTGFGGVSPQREMRIFSALPGGSTGDLDNPAKPGENPAQEFQPVPGYGRVSQVSDVSSRGLSVCLSSESESQTGRQSDLSRARSDNPAKPGGNPGNPNNPAPPSPPTAVDEPAEPALQETQARMEAEEVLGRSLLTLAGLPQTDWSFNSLEVVRPMRAHGLADDELLRVAQAAIAKRPPGKGIRNLSFFARVFDSHAKGLTVAPAPSPAAAATPPRPRQPERAQPPLGEPLDRLCSEARAGLRRAIPPSDYDAWLREAIVTAIEGDEVTIELPSRFLCSKVRADYAPQIERAFAAAAGRVMRCEFVAAAARLAG